jgi:hypothetical protein
VLTVPGGRDITQNGDFLNERPIIEYFLASHTSMSWSN